MDEYIATFFGGVAFGLILMECWYWLRAESDPP